MNTTGSFIQISLPDPLLDSIYLLDQNEFPKPWRLSEWQSLNWEHHFLYAQNAGEEVLGFVLLSKVKDDETAHLLKICFASRLRGTGCTQKLWDFALDEMKKLNAKSVYLEVEAQNTRAIKFYEKAGFATLRIIRGYYTDGGAAQTMQLTI